MGTYENFYLNQIKQLQEENKKLRAILNETIDDYGELEDGVETQDSYNWGEADSPKRTRKQLADEQLPRIYAAWEDVNKKRGGKARQLTRQEVRLLAFHADGLMDDMLRNIINRRVSDFDNLDRD